MTVNASSDLVPPDSNAISGEVDFGELNVTGVLLKGWAKSATKSAESIQIVILSSDQPAAKLSLPQGSEPVPFEISVPASFFRTPLVIELKVLAECGATTANLPLTGSAANLAQIRVGSRQDLLRLVQSPTERLKDPNLLFYTSYHSLSRFPGDFAAHSAATCVMGYRLIEGLVVPSSAREKFWERVDYLLRAEPAVPRGLWLRWHTSTRLVAGYLAFHEKNTQKAAEYFDGIGDFAFELSYWPAALTNVLIGIFLAGWIHYERGEFAEAAQAWKRAEGVLRYGSAISQLPNFYAYGELTNAIKVAQECYIGCIQAENGGKSVEDARIVPAGYQLDIRHLPGLRHNLGL